VTLALFLLMAAGYGAGAVIAIVAAPTGPARHLPLGAAVLGGAAGGALALLVLLTGTPFEFAIPWLLPGGLGLRLDGLGAFFLLLVSGGAIPAALYDLGYTASLGERWALARLHALFNLFLLAMGLVPCADTVLTFALAWEGMSLASYLLVLTDTRERETVRAGLWYLAMAQAGFALILAAFMLAGGAAVPGFADLRTSAHLLAASTRDLVFVLALLGFGSKAGLVPLHVWLPRAHPAAPSHVSALMSGVMIKLGVYGLLRLVLDILGGGPAWWGVVTVLLGLLTALVGVLYALMQDDLKRLLAYSSVENIGLVTIGVGAGLLFLSLGAGAAALLALGAALYHALNHAAFKGLLFLGAGVVQRAAGTRDMNRLGGLMRPLPVTAACFLVGSIALAGLPPLNGFASEWLLLQSLLPGVGVAGPLVAPLITVALGVFALTAGLAAVTAVKAFGITFLALPRSPEAAHAREAAAPLRGAMVMLAVACGGLGVAAAPIVAVICAALAALGRVPATGDTAFTALTLTVSDGFASMSPALLSAGLLALVAVVAFAVRRYGSPEPVRIGETWGCGRVGQTARMEYTATAFAEPLRRVFAEVYRPTEDFAIDRHPESRYFVRSIAYRSAIVPWFERYLYGSLVRQVRALAVRVRLIHSGSAHAYLAYLVGALLGLLGVLLVTGS
jgi:formate hydrogenlyase subunit 3/multisubunit Na+/H+ antiporter MnhD subunit